MNLNTVSIASLNDLDGAKSQSNESSGEAESESDSKEKEETSSMSEDLVTPSMLETILSELRTEIEETNKTNLRRLLERLEMEITPIRIAQESFYENWAEQMKAWRRARSDMQLYFGEMKKRDTLRDEYGVVAESLGMFIDMHKVGMQYESKEKWSREELQANQIKYNIIDLIQKKLAYLRSRIGVSMIHDHPDDYLNLVKYETHYTQIKEGKQRAALIKNIQEKYLKPVM